MGRRTIGIIIGVTSTLVILTVFVLLVIAGAMCNVQNTSGTFLE